MSGSYFVVDTNVLVSAAIFSPSIPNHCLRKIRSIGNFAYSSAVLREYREILLNDKFEKYLSRESRDSFLKNFINGARMIDVKYPIKACRDPKDDKYLELAIACEALCIITGDKDLLVMHPFERIPILTPGDFLRQF